MPRAAPDMKAAALADLMAGEQPAVVAERYGLDRDTVKSWKRRHVAPDDAPVAPDDAPVPTRQQPIVRPKVEAQKYAIGEMILDLLRAKLKASAALAEAASNPDWLREQSAAELATLGQWLDTSVFAIGDRLAGATPRDDSPDGE